jgi:tetratricopeptide (TPR) repeat protein
MLRPTLMLALIGLLLTHALPVRAQDGYGPPAGDSGGAAAQPPEKPVGPKTKGDEEEKKRPNYPISKRVSRYLATSLKLMQASKLPEAQATLEKIAGNRTLNPGERAKVEQFLGNVAVYGTDLPEATKHLSAALALNGLDPQSEQQVTFQLASIYAQLEEYPKAIELLDRWFQATDQPTPEAYYLRAVILIQMEKF